MNVSPKSLNDNLRIEEADILFLGCGIYAGDVHKNLKEFVEKLNPQKIKKVILFSTSGFGQDQLQPLKDKIKECGLNLCEETYCCKGKTMVFKNRNNPNENDLKEAVKFAKKFVNQQ